MEKLQHPGIIQIYDFGDDGVISKASGSKKENLVYLVLEYAPGGLLFEITEDLGSVGEEQARVLFKEMLAAVKFMHDNGVWHRDLKLENVLVDENLNIKLADLGFASC